jgi:tRNA (guanine37-N1)-methyltransferase
MQYNMPHNFCDIPLCKYNQIKRRTVTKIHRVAQRYAEDMLLRYPPCGGLVGKLFFVLLRKIVPMRIDIITVLPELLESPLNFSIIKRAKEKGLVEINIINLRDFTNDKYKSVDDYAFGGGAGMVMMIEPVYKAIEILKTEREYDEIIYTSPDGEKFNQKLANQLSMKENIIILAGHYKGVDQRIRDFLITREISVGDYVLSGGELPAAIIADAIVRLIPGAMSDEQSALSDSFQDDLLAPPVYTRPADFNGWKVPEILLSGHAAKIDNWRHEQAEERTSRLRPDLLKNEGKNG